MAAAITMLAKTMIREKSLTFEVNLDPFYSKSNLKACHKEVTEQFIANYQADRALFLKRLGKKPKTNSGRIY